MNLESASDDKQAEYNRTTTGSELLKQINSIEEDEDLYMDSIKDSLL